MLIALDKYIRQNAIHFDGMASEREEKLLILSKYISERTKANEAVNLTFICTHNSRRSQMSQLWAQVAAHYYHIPEVQCYSGGTEASAFSPRAVNAMQRAGFNIEQMDNSSNPVYRVTFAESARPLRAFSKAYSDELNPRENFAAVMTCAEAEEACPFIPGIEARISIPYEDPKATDNTREEKAKYDERCSEIAREMFYVFSNINDY